MMLQPTPAEAVRSTTDRLLNTPVFTIARTPVTPMTLVVFALIVLVTVGFSLLLRRAMHRAFRARGVTDVGTVALTTRLVHYGIVAVGLGVGLQTVGVDLGALFAAGAFFAIALGFAMQNVAQNFVSGIILVAERTIKPGDVLEVDGRVVRVTRMGLRATVARTRDEEDLIIPNGALVQNIVTNYTLRDPLFRLHATVGVSYGSDLALVMRVLREAAEGLPARLAGHDPLVLLTEFGDSAVMFDVSIWIGDPWAARRARSALNEAIWYALQRAQVSIPFPQRDLHLVSVPAALVPRAPAS